MERFRALFSTPDGEIVLEEIAKMGGLTRSSFSPDNHDKTIFNEGKRFLTLEIMRLVKRDPMSVSNHMINNET
jgi:hypothetical protein